MLPEIFKPSGPFCKSPTVDYKIQGQLLSRKRDFPRIASFREDFQQNKRPQFYA